MASPNITNIPAPRVELIDPRTGLMAREWYRFFLNLFNLTGGGANDASIADLQVGPPAGETGLVAFQAQDAALGLPPTTPYIPPDDIDPPAQETVPRGATGALQYNNGGVFYGALYMVYDGNRTLTLGVASNTLSSPIFYAQGANGSVSLKTGATLNFSAGNAYSASNGVGGDLLFTSGQGGSTGSGGTIGFSAGAGATGGAVNLTAGNGTTGIGGGVAITAGNSSGAVGGDAGLQPGLGATQAQDGTAYIATARGNIGVLVDQYANVTLSTPQTVASLISAATAGVGARSFVTDALAPVFGNTVVGGGAVKVPVYSDGTNWKVG